VNFNPPSQIDNPFIYGKWNVGWEWVMDLDEDEFIKLVAGDGLALRTQSAMPATQTWTYAYTIHYLEK
jgi:hypothetical protein